MLERQTHIESRVQKSLNSLEKIEKVKAPDFFYTRLQARMEAEVLGQSTRFFWIGNLKLSMAVMAVVFIMNFLSLFLIDFSASSENSNGLNTLSTEYFSPTDNYNYLSNE